MRPFCTMLLSADRSAGINFTPMLMAKSLCYDAVIAAT
jgi:hypothetical protein